MDLRSTSGLVSKWFIKFSGRQRTVLKNYLTWVIVVLSTIISSPNAHPIVGTSRLKLNYSPRTVMRDFVVQYLRLETTNCHHHCQLQLKIVKVMPFNPSTTMSNQTLVLINISIISHPLTLKLPLKSRPIQSSK